MTTIHGSHYFFVEGIERERGRENGSFPVEEALKPLGFKERSDVKFLPRAHSFS